MRPINEKIRGNPDQRKSKRKRNRLTLTYETASFYDSWETASEYTSCLLHLYAPWASIIRFVNQS